MELDGIILTWLLIAVILLRHLIHANGNDRKNTHPQLHANEVGDENVRKK